jgi:VIT1/CCC1 family predicted Fe2+/Mn2+ transporter
MKSISDEELLKQHSHQAIRDRIDSDFEHGTLGDVVLGAVDGTITTFAIVCGVAGTGLSQGVAVAFVLGLANVIADGFSMGVSNYLKARSDLQNLERYRNIERFHIERVPESEREEVRQIYVNKGFEGQLLEDIVSKITSNQELWENTMLQEEWGLQLNPANPMRSGFLTFVAFLSAGTIPLLPLLLGLSSYYTSHDIFLLSMIAAAVTFLFTGAVRGRVLHLSVYRSALETFLVGGTAAALAYFVGRVLSDTLLN